jgi:hypothetical protein
MGDLFGPAADAPHAEPDGDSTMAAPATTWVVWRQDDNGNRAVVSRHASRDEAEQVARTFEARGHKQIYWVKKDDA